MLRIHEIKRQVGRRADCLPGIIEKKIGLATGSIVHWRLVKESVDARDKSQVMLVCSVDFEVEGISQEKVLQRAKKKKLKIGEAPDETYVLVTKRPEYEAPLRRLKHRPVVVGFGPCGMFCALTLAQMGYAPLVLERGKRVEQRASDVERFWNEGIFDPESNVQFGEGGAGTFSDGKLTTQIKDGRIHHVIEEMIRAGGGEELRYRQKPHVGTDVLRTVVRNIREEICRLGGEVLFETKMTGLTLGEDGRVTEVTAERRLSSEEENLPETEILRIPAEAVVLALGHSARDTFSMLYETGIFMEQKPFSIGVRIEHPQEMIDRSQYGAPAGELGLGAAEYKLNWRCADGRGVYTFCMCPGGRVIASASEPETVVTNGMSYRSRDLDNANSGLLVDVRTEDFGSDHPLAGMEFQKRWEHQAYLAGGSTGRAPAQRVEDFLANRPTEQERGERNSITPSYQPGVTWTSLDRCLPVFACDSLREALPHLGRKLKGFDGPDGVLTGIETRSSSPVRIRRDDGYQARLTVSKEAGASCSSSGAPCSSSGESDSGTGIFPAGEGAGYAGGITSAAVDGIRIAEQIATAWKPKENPV